MENLSVHIGGDGLSGLGQDGLTMNVERLTWQAQGGPESAVIRGLVTTPYWAARAVEWAETVLLSPLEVRDQTGEACWWGYVRRVEVQEGGLCLALDLATLANRVCVEYWRREPQLEWTGVKTFTPWADDPDSQRRYGVHERIFRLGSLDEAQALLARDTLLKQHSQPHRQVSQAEVVDGVKVTLQGSGWYETLGWRTARFDDGYEGFVRPAATAQQLGRSTSDQRIAQSFRTGYGGWQLGEAVVNLRAVGVPGDLLRCQVCADASGVPGTALASAEVDSMTVSGGRWWVRFAFAQKVEVQANTDVWLVLSRSGAINTTNYYQVFTDAGNCYPNGKAMIWNGSTWTVLAAGLADINFYTVGYVLRLERLGELAALGGQFLGGLHTSADVEGETLLWAEGIFDCRQELEKLLEGGSGGERLQAQVDAGRRLVVGTAPAAWAFSLGADGLLRVRSGRLARCADQPAGQRALLTNGWMEAPVLVESVEWTPERGMSVGWEK